MPCDVDNFDKDLCVCKPQCDTPSHKAILTQDEEYVCGQECPTSGSPIKSKDDVSLCVAHYDSEPEYCENITQDTFIEQICNTSVNPPYCGPAENMIVCDEGMGYTCDDSATCVPTTCGPSAYVVYTGNPSPFEYESKFHVIDDRQVGTKLYYDNKGGKFNNLKVTDKKHCIEGKRIGLDSEGHLEICDGTGINAQLNDCGYTDELSVCYNPGPPPTCPNGWQVFGVDGSIVSSAPSCIPPKNSPDLSPSQSKIYHDMPTDDKPGGYSEVRDDINKGGICCGGPEFQSSSGECCPYLVGPSGQCLNTGSRSDYNWDQNYYDELKPYAEISPIEKDPVPPGTCVSFKNQLHNLIRKYNPPGPGPAPSCPPGPSPSYSECMKYSMCSTNSKDKNYCTFVNQKGSGDVWGVATKDCRLACGYESGSQLNIVYNEDTKTYKCSPRKVNQVSDVTEVPEFSREIVFENEEEGRYTTVLGCSADVKSAGDDKKQQKLHWMRPSGPAHVSYIGRKQYDIEYPGPTHISNASEACINDGISVAGNLETLGKVTTLSGAPSTVVSCTHKYDCKEAIGINQKNVMGDSTKAPINWGNVNKTTLDQFPDLQVPNILKFPATEIYDISQQTPFKNPPGFSSQSVDDLYTLPDDQSTHMCINHKFRNQSLLHTGQMIPDTTYEQIYDGTNPCTYTDCTSPNPPPDKCPQVDKPLCLPQCSSQ